MINSAIRKYKDNNHLEDFRPKAALFDMDGVLYNSMPNHAISWRNSMAEYGIDMTEQEAFLYEGMRGVETIQILAQRQWGHGVSEEEAQKMYRTKSEHYAQCAPADLIPGVHLLQEALKQAGMTIGVVTGSGQPSLLQRILRDFSGLVSPSVMVSALDVSRGKPAPDPYLMGMKKACVLPHETIVVENAPLGVKAAHAAGCFTIAVNTGPLPDDVLWQAGADIVLPHMQALIDSLHLLVK